MVQITSLVSLLALATTALSADIVGYTAPHCHGVSFKFVGPESGACVNFKFDVDSIRWTLPETSTGFAYSAPQCPRSHRLGPALTVRANKHAIKKRCFNYRTARVHDVRVRSAKWVDDVQKRGLEARNDDECQEPNVVTYEKDGEEYNKQIPTGKYDMVHAWVEAEDYEKLAELENYEE